MTGSGPQSAGVRRRLAAAFYDALTVVALWMVAYVPVVIVFGAHVEDSRNPLHQLFRAALCFAFFAWFWVRGGQTLGMKAWRLRVVRGDGGPLAFDDAVRRFGAALLYLAPFAIGTLALEWTRWWRWELALAVLPFVAGVAWSRVDRERLAPHDRLSATRVELLPKRMQEGL
jgi:uncharacterized RDD family membrane protein YckC